MMPKARTLCVRGRLLLSHQGYFHYHLFACTIVNGGHFLDPLKRRQSAHRSGPPQPRPGLVGERLQDVLARVDGEVLDVEVDMTFPRRTSRAFPGVLDLATSPANRPAILDSIFTCQGDLDSDRSADPLEWKGLST
jgi:hypothetical protein